MATDARILEIVLKARDETQKVLKGIGGAFKDVDTAALAVGAGMAATGAAVGMALKTARGEAMSYGREVVNIQRLTGMTAEESSKLGAVFNRLGIDQKQAGMVMKTLAGNITNNSKALQDMGIVTRDANGHARSQAEVLREVAEYYSDAGNKTEALANVTKTLGKGYQSLLPILAGGADGIDKVTAAAAKNGMILDESAIKGIKEYGKVLKDNEQAMKGFEVQMGLLTLPVETFKAQTLGGLIGKLNELSPGWKNAIGGGAMFAEVIGYLGSVVALAVPTLAALGFKLTGFAGWFTGITGSIGTSISGLGATIAGATGAAAAGLVALAGAVGFGIGSLINRIPAVKRFQKTLGEALGNSFYDASVKAQRGLDRISLALSRFPGKVRSALSSLGEIVRKPIEQALYWLSKLNPFQRRSPSLVDNVIAGTAVIARQYASLSGINLTAPSFAMAGAPIGMAGTRFGAQPIEQHTHIYLDGQEMQRSFARSGSRAGRTGVR